MYVARSGGGVVETVVVGVDPKAAKDSMANSRKNVSREVTEVSVDDTESAGWD